MGEKGQHKKRGQASLRTRQPSFSNSKLQSVRVPFCLLQLLWLLVASFLLLQFLTAGALARATTKKYFERGKSIEQKRIIRKKTREDKHKRVSPIDRSNERGTDTCCLCPTTPNTCTHVHAPRHYSNHAIPVFYTQAYPCTCPCEYALTKNVELNGQRNDAVYPR